MQKGAHNEKENGCFSNDSSNGSNGSGLRRGRYRQIEHRGNRRDDNRDDRRHGSKMITLKIPAKYVNVKKLSKNANIKYDTYFGIR